MSLFMGGISLFAQTPEIPVIAKGTTGTTHSGDDAVNESPRERSRVLLKRNPIASEYQSPGTLGLSPGSEADAEGVDFRARFRLRPRPFGTISTQTRLGADANLQSRAGTVAPGGRLFLARSLDANGRIQLQLNLKNSSSERTIEHYESVWNGYILDRARLSRDLLDTRNTSIGSRVDLHLSKQASLFYEAHASWYNDVFYRNRLEYQIGRGTLTGGDLSDDSATLARASVVDLRTRRYFGNTRTDRKIQRHQVGSKWETEASALEIAGYYSKWINKSIWHGWNFRDTGIDLDYDIRADPTKPELTISNNFDPMDTSTATFTDYRIYDTRTEDTDVAARLDYDRRLQLGNHSARFAWGAQYRTKERIYRQERPVYYPGTESFSLDAVDKETPGGWILDHAYALPKGISPERFEEFFEADDGSFFTQNLERTFVESAQNYYDTEESVLATYFKTYQRIRDWRWSAGVRLEQTATQSLGTVTGDPEVLANVDGIPITSVAVHGLTIEDQFASVDAKLLPGENTYTNILPSIDFRYEPESPVSIRGSFYQSMMRPQYYDIVRYRRISTSVQSISEGNPDLSPTLIDSLAIALRYESEFVGEFMVEAYYKEIADFFYDAVSWVELPGYEGNFQLSTTENGRQGSISGFQVQWSRDFARGIGSRDRFRLSGAYTYSDTAAIVESLSETSGLLEERSIPLPERSKHLFQANLDASWNDWTFSSQFSYQSQALDGVGSAPSLDEYREKVLNWSNTVGLRFGKRYRMGLTLLNILNHPERSYVGSDLRVTRNQYSFQSIHFSITGEF